MWGGWGVGTLNLGKAKSEPRIMDKHAQEWLIPTPSRLKKQLRLRSMPWQMVSGIVLLVCLATVPLALVSRARSKTSTKPRVHLFQDMDNQPKYKTQSPSPIFADGRSMRPPVAGTVARGHLEGDDHYDRGFTMSKEGDAWSVSYFKGFPEQVVVDDALLQRGQERFLIYCSPCHGADGLGNGMVHVRATELKQASNGWTQPTDITTLGDREAGHLYNTIRNGIRTMPGYAAQIPTADRWAIVAYVRALQLSQNATLDDVPADKRDKIQ